MTDDPVYFDIQAWGFRTLREKIPGGWRASGLTSFYDDARTTTRRTELSDAYVDRNLVDTTPIFDFQFAELHPGVDAYRVIPRPE